MTQKDLILTALENGERLTPIDALQQFGCFRLASRISELKQEGHLIKKKMITNSWGKMFAQYRLETK
tara:strand:- start:1575 stop:1775 length:201 start_codon:yes stop_codon:yes gene_type:complete